MAGRRCADATVRQMVAAIVAGGAAVLIGAVVARVSLAYLRTYRVVRWHARFRQLRGAQLPFAPLSHADLFNAQMPAANLMCADCRRCFGDGINLRGANLRGARLQDARLFAADLRGTNL